jgi:hypothetical protein
MTLLAQETRFRFMNSASPTKRFPAAEAALHKAVELSSAKYPAALYLLAGLLHDQQRFTEAEAPARQAVALDEHSRHGTFRAGASADRA